ncbi:centromere protein W isoform X1 [Aotus nancymaae]|uniref:centromere protein W isoform X1 n=1 Tax=Aotus nancymaae TaxID=37293 RepID=UPI0030FEB7E7
MTHREEGRATQCCSPPESHTGQGSTHPHPQPRETYIKSLCTKSLMLRGMEKKWYWRLKTDFPTSSVIFQQYEVKTRSQKECTCALLHMIYLGDFCG